MDLGPEEKFLRFSELSENRALKPFAHFCVQPAAPGLNTTRMIALILTDINMTLTEFRDSSYEKGHSRGYVQGHFDRLNMILLVLDE